MNSKDIKEYNEDKIENINDFVDYWCYHRHMEYDWRKDDGDEYLIVWLDFCSLKSFTKLFNSDIIDECPSDFECVLRHNCVVFPHFENILEHCNIDKEDINKIFG